MSIAVLLLALSLPARADVATRVKAQSGGLRGAGAFESTGERWVSGLKAREDGNMRFTGAILGRVGGKKGRDSARILRVDLDKRWDLNPKKKTYRESPISLPPPDPAEAKEDEAPSKPAKEPAPTHKIKRASVSVEKTGETRTINGFKAARHKGVFLVEVEELESGKTSEFKLLADVWTAPWTKDLRKAVEEEARFAKAYMAKLGSKLSPEDQSRFGLAGARALLGAGGPEIERAMAKLKAELGKVEGFPVLTESAWHAPAEDMDKARMDDDMDDDGTDGFTDDLADGRAEKAVAGFLGGIAKRAARKKAKEKLAPKPGAPVYSIRTEVLSVSVADVPKDRFEVPAGFKKK